MKLTKDLIKACFGPKARIRRQLTGGYKVKTESGGEVLVSEKKMKKISGGTDVNAAAVLLARKMGWDKLVVSGNTKDAMDWVIPAQSLGMDAKAGTGRSWLGFKTPPPVIPYRSGAHGDAGIATREMISAAALTTGKRGQGIRLCEDGYGSVIRYTGPNSIAMIGPQRSGKLATIAAALTVENQSSMVLIDPKGEIFAITRRARAALGPMKIICPFFEGLPQAVIDLVGEADSFNILDLMDPASESFEMACDAAGEMLVSSDGAGETKNAGYFTGNAQMAASGVIMQLVTNYAGEANLSRVCEILSTDEIFPFARTAMKTGNKYVKSRLSMFSDEKAMQSEGVRDFQKTAREQLRFMASPAMERVLRTPKKPWRWQDLKDGTIRTVYIIIPAKFAASAGRLYRMLIGNMASEIISSPAGKHHVTCLCDEFPTLGRIPIIDTLFTMGAGLGLSMIPMAQNVGQMITVHGQHGWRNIASGCEMVIYLPPRDLETAQEISRLAGKRTILTRSVSAGGRSQEEGINIGETGQPVLDPHQVLALRPDQCVIHAPGLVKDIIIGHRKFYKLYPDIAALCDPNPYHATDVKQPSREQTSLRGPSPPESVTVRCPHCGASGQIRAQSLGCKLRCPAPACKKEFWTHETVRREEIKK